MSRRLGNDWKPIPGLEQNYSLRPYRYFQRILRRVTWAEIEFTDALSNESSAQDYPVRSTVTVPRS